MELEIKVPPVGESITEVTLSRWAKKDGDYVKMDEIIAELESDKATFELTAEKAGTLKRMVAEGDTVPVGNLVALIQTDGTAPAEVKSSPAPVQEIKSGEAQKLAASENKGDSYAKGIPSPAASKVLSEKGLQSVEVNGTGRDGRITLADAQGAQVKPAPAQEKMPQEKLVLPIMKGERSEKREKLSNLRRTIGKRLVAVKNETAMLTTFNEVDMQPIMDLRSRYKDKFKEKYEVGLGFMSFFTKAVCEAIKDFPAVNAMINGEEIVYHNYVDISIAVSAPKGLMVPVIRNAESMSFAEIEKTILALAGKARDNKLSVEEMTGGTFSITNGGVFGSMLSTPILNPPQSAILGMHNIVERAVVIAGKIEIRPIMYLALSYDHRIIDGRESVSFLVKVKQYLEDPGRLLLGL